MTRFVLAPCRMGIPHKGHIALIKKTIELGFHPIVSLHKTFTSTEDDPLPKWIVAKMIQASLRNESIADDAYEFMFMPYDIASVMRMQYVMHPHWQKIEGFVTGNPDVKTFFEFIDGDRFWLDQNDLFGHPEPLSWGAKLRDAIRLHRDCIIREYIASGVEQIMSLNEIRAWDNSRPTIEHMPVNRVKIRVNHEISHAMVPCIDPETQLKNLGYNGKLTLNKISLEDNREMIDYQHAA